MPCCSTSSVHFVSRASFGGRFADARFAGLRLGDFDFDLDFELRVLTGE